MHSAEIMRELGASCSVYCRQVTTVRHMTSKLSRGDGILEQKYLVCAVIFVVGVELSLWKQEKGNFSVLRWLFYPGKTSMNRTDRDARGIRATSAGRFPDSTWRAGTPSLYHEKCAPQIERVKSAPPRTYAQREYAKCDVVRNDEIWKNRCRNEGKMTRKW